MNSAKYDRRALQSAAVLVVVVGQLVFGPLGSAKAQLLEASGPLPSFEVATIKPSRSAADPYSFRLAEERLMGRDVPLARLIRFAYNVKSDSQIENVPAWAGGEKFDIDAKIADAQFEKMKNLPPDRRFEQYQLMLQSLLADRFKLRISTRMKELPVYALVVVKGGPKLSPAEVSQDPGKQRYGEMAMKSKGELNASAVSMARLAQALAGTPEAGDRVVIDETGLTGRYDFTLNWTPIEGGANAVSGSGTSEPATGAPAIDQGGPSLFTALPEQLGLKLVPIKAPVEVLVIEHVERPSAN